MFELTSVNAVLDDQQALIDLNDSFEVDDFAVEGLVYHVQGPAVFQATLTHTGDGVLVHGNVELPVTVACVRCLEDTSLVLKSAFDIIFYLKPTVDEEGDALPAIDEQGNIALKEEVYAALRVEAPFAPICSDECEGLCPKCGINLNEETCTCSQEVDPHHPFAGLSDLIKAEDD